MKARLKLSGGESPCVSEMILGQNLEAYPGAIEGMLSERLTNPKFAGPVNAQTGIAPGWQPRGNHMGAFRCELTQGMSYSGNESQLLLNPSDQEVGILQTERWIKAGETLEVEIWARVAHHPVTLRVALGGSAPSRPYYASAKVTVDASYWKRYQVTLKVSCDDPAATFYLFVEQRAKIWIDQIHMKPAGETHLRHDLVEKLRSMQIPALRFPGGCQSTNHHWRHGTGALAKRPALLDPIGKWSTSYEFGTDEYLGLCHELGIRPHITVNVGSGTPEEAAGWASYCAEWFKRHGADLPVIYFQIGNEHYGLWESAHMTGAMYVETLKEFVPAIREAYPKARVVALGEEMAQGLTKGEANPWRSAVLKDAGAFFDVLAINRYKGQWNTDAESCMVNAAESVEKISRDLRSLIADCRAHGLEKRVALTEWNYWLYARHWDGRGFHEPWDIQHSLFLTGMLNEFARLAPDFELGNFYHLINGMAIFDCHGPEVLETDAAEVFRLYRAALPGRYCPISIESPPLGNALAVDAICLESDEGRWLFVSNRSPSEEAVVELDGFPAVAMEGVLLRGDDPLEPFSTRGPIRAGGSNLRLPPLSFARFRF